MVNPARASSGSDSISSSVDKVFLDCFEKQMNSLKAIGLTVAAGRSQSTLLFGLPGNGRTFALRTVMSLLARDHSSAFASILNVTPASLFGIVKSLDGLTNPFEAISKQSIAAKRPTLLCFEEIDAYSPPHILLEARPLESGSDFSRSFSNSVLTSEFASFLDRIMIEERIWVVGIVNSPGDCAPAIIQRFTIPIFFGMPELNAIEAIIGNMLGTNRGKAIGRLLVRKTSEFGIYLSFNALIYACNEVNREKTLKELSDEDIVSRILAFRGSGITAESVKRYERINSGFINVSLNEAMPFWSKELKRLEVEHS